MGVARGSRWLGTLLLFCCVLAEQDRSLPQIGSAEGASSAYPGAIQDANKRLHQAWPLRLQSSAAQTPSGPEASLQQCPALERSLCGAAPFGLILVVHYLNQCAADSGLQSTEQLQAGVNDSARTPGMFRASPGHRLASACVRAIIAHVSNCAVLCCLPP